MSIYFHLERLIKKYSTSFVAKLPQEGRFVNGEYTTAGTAEIELTGAIIDISERLIHDSNGTLTAKDKVLYISRAHTQSLVGAKIVHKGNVYNVEDVKENYDFTGFCCYTLKYNSRFSEGQPC